MEVVVVEFFVFFKQKTAYEMRISDWSSDVCSSDLSSDLLGRGEFGAFGRLSGREACRPRAVAQEPAHHDHRRRAAGREAAAGHPARSHYRRRASQEGAASDAAEYRQAAVNRGDRSPARGQTEIGRAHV